jgi:hypothetical protein
LTSYDNHSTDRGSGPIQQATSPWDRAKALQRPLPDDALKIAGQEMTKKDQGCRATNDLT